jgi:hypothetical protein
MQDEIDDAADMDTELVLENPKDVVGATKLPLHLWPATATALGSIALHNGACKYGRSNWRKAGIRATRYTDALRRHIAAWEEGEECDEEGIPHLSSALACLAIMVDARAAGTMTDDRQFPGGYKKLVEQLTPLVKAVTDKHADKAPKHWTIGDAT